MRTLVILLFLGAAPLVAKRHALVVGINEYAKSGCAERPRPPHRGLVFTGKCPAEREPNLTNAVRDANLFAELLRGRYGFAVKPLQNEQATAKAILEAFEAELIHGMGRGDTAVFYFAGHGTRVQNVAGGWQESLVPYDFLAGEYPLLDVEMGALYAKAVNQGVALAVVLDSCFSGGMGREVKNQLRRMDDQRTVKLTAPAFDGQGRFALLAAAQGHQPATDQEPTFTRWLVTEVNASRQERSVSELARLVGKNLSVEQSPFAGGEGKTGMNVAGLPVRQSANEYITTAVGRVGIGWVNGMTQGSVLEGAGVTYRVSQVDEFESTLDGKAPKGTRLRLVKREGQIGVWVPDKLPDAADIARLAGCAPDWEAAQQGARVRWADGDWVLDGEAGRRKFDCEAARGMPVELPPSRELRAALEDALEGESAMLRPDPRAEFAVVGRLKEGRLEYALEQRGKLAGLVERSRWNEDAYEEKKQVQTYQVRNCADETARCAQILTRRIMRAKGWVDFHRAAERTAGDPAPFEFQLRTRRNGVCGKEVVSRLKPGEGYCSYVGWRAEYRLRDPWYLQVLSVDGLGMVGDPMRLEGKTFPDGEATDDGRWFKLGTYGTGAGEHRQETVFLFMGKQQLPVQDLVWCGFQQAPKGGRDGVARPLLKRTGFAVRAVHYPVDVK